MRLGRRLAAGASETSRARMILYVVAFVGGVLAIFSPCILPVLPFVFARADQPFRRSGLPLLAGMALTFAIVGAAATLAGTWIIRANQVGRLVAMALFAVFGLTLLFPSLAERVSRPFVRAGASLQRPGGRPTSVGGSILLGVSTGLLWTPCAGPILGLLLTTAAAEGAGARSVGLLFTFAVGSAVALAIALLASRRVFRSMTRALGADVWIRRVLGAAVLVGVVGIALGWDTGVLARLSLGTGLSATGLEETLVNRVRPAPKAAAAQVAPTALTVNSDDVATGHESMPPLDGAIQWLNGPPETRESLRGKVVLVDFWTYSCINCLRSLPYVEAWSKKYRDQGLVVIGVHTPEFAFERDPGNVSKAVRQLGLTYPVAIDSNHTIWNAFDNEYWPAHYFIDAHGIIRFHHFGEGNYDESERIIQTLLAERNGTMDEAGLVTVAGTGAEAAANFSAVQSPETYVGYDRAEHFASPEKVRHDRPAQYTAPKTPALNQWGLDGRWTVTSESGDLASAPGAVVFRFHARDLHLVLGPAPDGTPIRFRVRLDGAPPQTDAGVDVDADGNGTVTENRLYQLIRQKGAVADRTFEIEFLDPGVRVFSFTFG